MTDRNVQFPNRFEIVPVPGTTNIFDVTPAPGAVYKDGTFWNKQNVLKDATAALYGKTADAVPDDIFAAIRPLITAAQNTANGKARIVAGSYVGTNTYGENNPNSITFPFAPKLVLLPVRGGKDAPDIGELFYQTGYHLWLLAMENMPTTYQSYAGLGNTYNASVPYGKKSSSGTTIYWYNTISAANQFNDSRFRYHYIAIG